jgi:hypothetical protein
VKFRVPVQALRKDVEYLYECNIREPPMEQNLPLATVIVMEDPSLYLRMGDDVRVKGYFYKVRQYEGTRGVGHAPMVIARRLEPVAGPAAEGAPIQWLLGVMFAVLVALIVSFFVIRQIVRPKPDAAGTYPVHKFRLRRDGGAEPPAGGGTPGPGDLPKP